MDRYPVILNGWTLRDLSGGAWHLEGILGPLATKTIRRNGQPMSMNNRGDTIDLVDPNGLIVDSASYEMAQEGERVVN